MKNIADLIARLFIAFLFFFEAYDTIKFYEDMQVAMAAYGMPKHQDFLLITALVLLILGATLVLLGYRSRFGALLLLLYWIPVTFIVYSFWNDPEIIRRTNSLIFMRNLAIAGGLLVIFVNGSGDYSVKRLLNVMSFPRSKW